MKDALEGPLPPLVQEDVAASLFYGFVFGHTAHLGVASGYYYNPEADIDHLMLVAKALHSEEVEQLLTLVEHNLTDVAEVNYVLSFLPDTAEIEVIANQSHEIFVYNSHFAGSLDAGESITIALGDRLTRGLSVHESDDGVLQLVGQHEGELTGIALSFTENPGPDIAGSLVTPNFRLLVDF